MWNSFAQHNFVVGFRVQYKLHIAENVKQVWQAVSKSVIRSPRRQPRALSIIPRYLGQILQKDLLFNPYEIRIVHTILRVRIQFCGTFLHLFNRNILNHIMMCDEVNFHLSRYMKERTFQYWAVGQPQ